MNSNWKQVLLELDNQIKDKVIILLQEKGADRIVIDKGVPGDSSIVTNKNPDFDKTYIKTYFQDESDCISIIESIKNIVAQKIDINSLVFKYDISELKEKDWTKSWHKYFSPTPVGDYFLVCPSWYDIPDTERKVIEIDPGQAFGVGTHESTRLAVDWLEEFLVNIYPNHTLLDVGTGTGILSIIASYLGLKNIDAIDISKQAVEAANNNITINKAGDSINVYQRDINIGLTNNYNYVIANLLPDLIIDLLPNIVSALKENGILILSGIILERENEVLNHININKFSMIGRKVDGDWVSISFRKG